MAKSREHPTIELERLVDGVATADERQRVVAHLLAGCRGCGRRVAAAFGPPSPKQSDAALGRAVARAVRRFGAIKAEVDKERAVADRLLADLEELPHGRALTVLASSRRHQRRAVCEELLQKAAESRRKDPRICLHCAEQALAVASSFSGAGSEELKARSWIELANARRIGGDLPGAESGFEKAEAWLEADGGRDPAVRAELHLMLARQRNEQRRINEALALTRRSRRAFERLRDRRGVAEAALLQAKIYGDSGDLDQAMAAAWKALLLIGPRGDLDALLAGIHNMMHWMAEGRDPSAAIPLMEAARPIYEACGRETDLARLDWVRARLELRLGRLDEASWAFEAVREQLAAFDLPYDVAQVSLDLAYVYARQGRTFELRELIADALPVFRGLEIARETIAALTLLRRAEAADARTAGIIRGLAETVAGQRAGRTQPLPPLP